MIIGLLGCAIITVEAAPNVVFTDIPKNMEICPRLPSTNIANVKVAGTIYSPGYDFIIVKILREGVLQYPVSTQTLVYSGNQADFNLSGSIVSLIAVNWSIRLSLIKSSTIDSLTDPLHVINAIFI